MICSCSHRRRQPRPGPSRGFTMVELLVVIVILILLLALLLPAINGALRAGRNAAASAEISQMATALTQFKSQYGVYPPSRVILSETGDYSTATVVSATGLTTNAASALAQRSVSYFR